MRINLELNPQVTNWLHSFGLVPDNFETDCDNWETGTNRNPNEITLGFEYNYEAPDLGINEFWEFYGFTYICNQNKEWPIKETTGEFLPVPRWLKQQLITTVENYYE